MLASGAGNSVGGLTARQALNVLVLRAVTSAAVGLLCSLAPFWLIAHQQDDGVAASATGSPPVAMVVLGVALVADALVAVASFNAHREHLGAPYADFDLDARDKVRRLTHADGMRAVGYVCALGILHACTCGIFGAALRVQLTGVGRTVLGTVLFPVTGAHAYAWFSERRGAWIKPD